LRKSALRFPPGRWRQSASVRKQFATSSDHWAEQGGGGSEDYPIWGLSGLVELAVRHLLFLVGLRNRMQVFFQWTWAYFTYAKGARLIYGPFSAASGDSPVGQIQARVSRLSSGLRIFWAGSTDRRSPASAEVIAGRLSGYIGAEGISNLNPMGQSTH
jgi:hypothetical protein